jgi:hypothetical protein
MPLHCTVCQHPKRQEIDRARRGRRSASVCRAIQARAVVNAAASNEAPCEENGEGIQVREGREAVEAVKLVEVAREMLTKLQNLANDTEKDKDRRGAVAAIGKIPDFLRMLGEIEGRLQAKGSINVAITPEWCAQRHRLPRRGAQVIRRNFTRQPQVHIGVDVGE